MASFQTLYNRLNPEQKTAVDTIEGPVMVIAGPGTGKTQILTLRIANILQQTDTQPDAILALTFTEAGAFAMRRRLVEIIGSPAYRVGIFTFHSFASELIRRYPDQYPRILASTQLSDIDKFSVMERIIESEELARLKPFGDRFYYLKDILRTIGELKRENIPPEEAKKRVARERQALEATDDLYHEKGAHKGKMKGAYANELKKIEKNEELCRLYERYEEVLHEEKRYDFDDMIVETIHALDPAAGGDEQFLLAVQEEYHYLLADEHQDANNGQNKLLELLASFHESPNLFLVGDAKQAIYRFQGASLENFLYFTERYPDATLIRLTTNYRSQQLLLDASYSLIARGELAAIERKEPLEAHEAGAREPIKVGAFTRADYEALYVAEHAKRLIAEGASPHEIAILYRANADAAALTPALEKLSVPYIIESDQDVLADPDIHHLTLLLRAAVNFGEDEALAKALPADFLGVDPLDFYKLAQARRASRLSLHDLLKNKKALTDANVEHVDQTLDLYGKLARFAKLAQNAGLLEALERIAHESGFVAHLIEHPRSRAKLESYAGLLRDAQELVEAHREYKLADLIRYLDILEEHRILLKRRSLRAGAAAVRLMTAHKAKGLEFDHVIITQAFEGHWGRRRTTEHFSIPIIERPHGRTDEGTSRAENESEADERRLFYVALTRARETALITYAGESISGRQQLPSQFLEEIDESYREEVDTAAFEEAIDPVVVLSPKPVMPLSAGNAGYLRELFRTQGLSVTALNNYVKSPWEYFFTNLLRLPRVPSKHLVFGDAVHKALQDAFERTRAGEPLDRALLLSRFRAHLLHAPLAEADYDEVLAKGEESLAAYFAHYEREFLDPSEPIVKCEWDITVLFRVDEELAIPLRGKLDKVLDLGGGRVRVLDYKTGRPKSRNWIEGKTKDSNGDYKRQLAFYKLLLSLSHEQQGGDVREMEEGVIDFVEPDAKGRFKREVFSIEKEDVDELTELIRTAAREIDALSFWNAPCDPSKCDYCPLRDALVVRDIQPGQ